MKQLNITFEDSEHKKLVKAKGDMGWREFIMKLTEE